MEPLPIVFSVCPNCDRVVQRDHLCDECENCSICCPDENTEVIDEDIWLEMILAIRNSRGGDEDGAIVFLDNTEGDANA